MEPFKYASVITTISVFTALFSIIIQAYMKSNDLRRVTNVLTNLLFLENNVTRKVEGGFKPRVAIGYGSSRDFYIRATDFLNYTDGIGDDLDVDEINTERDLLTNFAYYFQRGIASERYIQNKELFRKLLQKTQQQQKDSHWNLGGNAPVMAMRFYHEGADVLLGARMSKILYERLNPEVKLSDTEFLDDDADDIHLILEYHSGETWGQFTAPRDNHFIIYSDAYNPRMNFFHKFSIELPKFNPRLMIVSGLHLFSSESRENNLNQIQAQLRNLPRLTLIHVQMASFFESIFFNQMLDLVIPYTDSLGMNEQQLASLHSMLEKGIISEVVDINPPTAASLDQLRSVFIYLHDRHRKNKSRGRQVTRIHLRTLGYQIIMRVKSSEWTNTKQSTAKASIRASKHVCGMEILNPESFSLLLDKQFTSSEHPPLRTIPLKDNEVVACWSELLRTGYESVETEFCVAPNLVCKNAIQTVGAGENIAAAGLILAI